MVRFPFPTRLVSAAASVAFACTTSSVFAAQTLAKPPTSSTVRVDEDGVHADSLEDCSGDNEADSPRCTRTTVTDLGTGGFRANATEQRITAVHAPISSATQSGLSAALILGSGDRMEMVGGSFGAQLRFLDGGLFPGAAGGTWFGYFVEPSVQISMMSTTVTTPRTCVAVGNCAKETQSDSSSGSMLLSGTVGVQYMQFDPLAAGTLEQSGFGIAVGIQAAAVIPLEDGETTTSIGPAFSLLRPTYNPGTARIETDSLNLFLLPSDSFFMMILGYSGSVS